MTNDNGLALDIEALIEATAETDVLVIGFDFMVERMVIDFRVDPQGGSLPILELAEPMADARERVAWLAERRPALAPPDRFLFFVWPHSTASLTNSRVAEQMLDRLRDEHGVDYRHHLVDVAGRLRRAERAEKIAAIRGIEGFETIWSGER